MPVVWLERLPLPNLKTYTCVSVVALSACVYFALQVIKDPEWELATGDVGGKSLFQVATGVSEGHNRTNNSNTDTRTISQWMSQAVAVMVREPICVWTVINMAFCWLILMGRCVQKLVFGELRVSEQQHLKDKFWNFIFYKFIFIFGIVNVQYVDEVLLWCSWFALLGFLQLLSLLASDRFEYLSFSPTTPIWSHAKLLALLAAIFAMSGFMFVVSIFVGFFGGLNTFAFMSAEVILLSIRSLHVIIRYGIHLYELRSDDNEPPITTTSNDGTTITSTGRGWHQRGGPVTYYTNLGFDLMALAIDFLHHSHMLVWSNILLSMASLVVCMQLRYLMNEIQRKIKRHRNYLWVRDHLERNYPMASGEEIAENSDNCAICWEKMEEARKLPCAHLFHNACLQSWLEQDKSCPTCRLVLTTDGQAGTSGSGVASATDADAVNEEGQPLVGGAAGQQQQQQAMTRPQQRHLQHFFHFDASRYVSWLPSFSVEVSHGTNAVMQGPDIVMAARTSQLEEMARQVQQLFPHMPLSTVVSDLRMTYSAELTIENILDGRLVAAPQQRFREMAEHTTNTNSTGGGGISVNQLNNNGAAVTVVRSRPSLSQQVLAAGLTGGGNNLQLRDEGKGKERELQVMEQRMNGGNVAVMGNGGWDVDDIDTEDTVSLGSRFSKSPTERERILYKRKEMLIHEARKRYLEKQKNTYDSPEQQQS